MNEVGGRRPDLQRDGWFDPQRVIPRWWVLALAAVIAVGVAAVASMESTTRASTSATYVLSTASNLDDPFDVSSSLGVLRGREVISTFAEILESSSVREVAVAQTAAPDAGAYVVEAAVQPGSNIVKINVTGPASGYAGDVATSIGEEATARFEGLYPIYRVDPLDVASTPVRSVSDLARNSLLAMVAAVAAAGFVSAVIPLRDASDAAEEEGRLAETIALHDDSVVLHKQSDPSDAEEEPPAEEESPEASWGWRKG